MTTRSMLSLLSRTLAVTRGSMPIEVKYSASDTKLTMPKATWLAGRGLARLRPRTLA